MVALLNLFWDICLLRKRPQDVPASEDLLKLTLLTYAGSGLLAILLSLQQAGVGTALLLTLADVALLAALTYAVLYMLGYLARFTQTLTALAGVGTLLQLIATPLGLWYQRSLVADGAAAMPALLWLLLLIWSIAVTAHILRHAFSVSYGFGVLYALGYLMVSRAVVDWLLPAAA